MHMNPRKYGRPKHATAALFAAALAASLAGTAIAPANASPPANAQVERQTDMQDVKREWQQASQALLGYTTAQRDQALERGRSALESMDRRIDRLEAQAMDEWQHLGKAARRQRQESLRALRKQRNEAAEWYGEMKQGTAGAWNEVRQGFVDAYGVLGESLDKAATQFDRASVSKKK